MNHHTIEEHEVIQLDPDNPTTASYGGMFAIVEKVTEDFLIVAIPVPAKGLIEASDQLVVRLLTDDHHAVEVEIE